MAAGFSVAISAIDGASAVIDRINRRIAAVSAPVNRLQASFTKLASVTGFTAISNGLRRIAETGLEVFRNISRIIAPLSAITGAASAAGIYRLTTSWAEFASRLGFTAQRIGLTTGQLQGLQGAARLSGASADDLSSGMQTLRDNMVNAVGGAAPEVVTMMQTLGVSFRDAATGGARDVTRAMPELADAIRRIRDPTLQATAATTLFGGAGERLLPFLRMGSEGIAEYARRATEYGVVNERGIEAANRLRMAQTSLTMAVEGFGNSVAQQLAPVLSPLLEQMARWIAANREWIATDIGQKVEQFATYIQGVDWAGIGHEIHTILEEVNSVVQAFGGWKTAAEVLLAFMAGKWALGMIGSILKVSGVLRGAFKLPALAGFGGLLGGASIAGLIEQKVESSGFVDTTKAMDERLERMVRRESTDDDPHDGLFNRLRDWLLGTAQAEAPMRRGRGPGSDPQSLSYQPGTAAYALPTGPQTRISPVEASLRAQQAFDYFRTRGMDTPHAAAEVAQIRHESDFQETMVHDQGTGYGILGWRADRLARLQGRYGARPTYEQQLEFMADEQTRGTEASNAQPFFAARDARTAAARLSADVVRPRDVQTNMQVRGETATRYEQMFAGRPAPVAAPPQPPAPAAPQVNITVRPSVTMPAPAVPAPAVPAIPTVPVGPAVPGGVAIPTAPALPAAPPIMTAPAPAAVAPPAAMAPPVPVADAAPAAPAAPAKGTASLRISFANPPAGMRTSTTATGDLWESAPRVERPFAGYAFA